MDSLECNQSYHVPPHVLYKSFLNERDLTKMAMGSSCKMESTNPGASFYLMDNSVQGSFISLDKDKEIRQKWRFSDWEDDVYSQVVITFEELDDTLTNIKISQTKIPKSDKYGNNCIDRCRAIWNQFFFERLSHILGYPKA